MNNMNIEFNPFPKIARLSRKCIITEKIDGTNASIYIGENGEFLIGSRNRWITPEDDNYDFAKWAMHNKEELLKLGVGHHFGEWWGRGINRNYNLKERKFSLFNTTRWCEHNQEPERRTDKNFGKIVLKEKLPECCNLVPILYEGLFDTFNINRAIEGLSKFGSIAAPGFMNPEGIMIYHIAGNISFKKTIEKDELPKSL